MAKKNYLERTLEGTGGLFVAASDYVKALPNSIAKWLPGRLAALGTDGFGRSDGREGLREFFEVNARHIAATTLAELCRDGQISGEVVKEAMKSLEIDADKLNPLRA